MFKKYKLSDIFDFIRFNNTRQSCMVSYRKELDGIRALAVIAVILYHADFQLVGKTLFKGGYLGVDVFFVLSGYLITGIIRDKLGKGNFSIVDFYWRRIKRIVPALLVVLIFTSICAYFVLTPGSLIAYAKSLKSALYFGSNYYFLSEDSYISEASIHKPLLHTWSLAVEWQFYVLFPVIILFINKFFKRYMLGILVVMMFLSLQYANIIVGEKLDEAFYLLPSRAWELFAGGIATFYDRSNINTLKDGAIGSLIVKLMPIFGLFLVVHSMLFFGHDNPHPSFMTAIPVIGVCLFIIFTNKGDVANDILSTKPFVFIGIISYSLYLWHQPIFVFFRLLKSDEINHYQLIILIIITMSLSIMTYYLIENKFRVKKLSVFKIITLILMASLLFFFYKVTIETKGFSNRFSGKLKEVNERFSVLEFRKLKDDINIGRTYKSNKEQIICTNRTIDTLCSFGSKEWINIGDSFSGQLDPELKKILENKGQGFISMTYEQCPFVSTKIWFGNTPECPLVNEDRLKYFSNLQDKKKIIITSNYSQFYSPKKIDNNNSYSLNKEIAWDSYADNIKFLLSKGHEVYVIYPIPTPYIDVRNRIMEQLKVSSSFKEEFSPSEMAYKNAIHTSNKLDLILPDHPNLHKIYPVSILCEHEQCLIINKDGAIYSGGGGHLTDIGAKMILDKFL